MHKNVETILQVCQRMKEENVQFIITTKPNEYYKCLQRRVQELQLTNVVFLQYLEQSQLLALYKMARLNLYLSLYEGFGFPPAEASYFKTQSLLSTATALPEIYGAEFEFSDPFDIDQIVATVKKYILPEDKIEVDSYQALKQKYNWQQTAEETVRIFKEILN